MTIFVHNGKGGKDALVFITDDCAKTLRRYLEVRAPLVIGGRKPLFYADFGGRWERRSVYRMFMTYKKLAGIEKHGGVHVFGRHSMGSLLVKRGCDIVTIKELMRHSMSIRQCGTCMSLMRQSGRSMTSSCDYDGKITEHIISMPQVPCDGSDVCLTGSDSAAPSNKSGAKPPSFRSPGVNAKRNAGANDADLPSE